MNFIPPGMPARQDYRPIQGVPATQVTVIVSTPLGVTVTQLPPTHRTYQQVVVGEVGRQALHSRCRNFREVPGSRRI